MTVFGKEWAVKGAKEQLKAHTEEEKPEEDLQEAESGEEARVSKTQAAEETQTRSIETGGHPVTATERG
ncbi:hypothetical protein H920_18568 [Fukomys damarensis]|uniref:Uncharacterized protein n=1 Tax=Fukomys damarensis TaxID=885580 RepID=A0A091CPQ5_FUKDA|nr:hypothetical protein H920_18568 [Fukomys damarensis]